MKRGLFLFLLFASLHTAQADERQELLAKYPRIKELVILSERRVEPDRSEMSKAYALGVDELVGSSPTSAENFRLRQAYLAIVRQNPRLRRQANLTDQQLDEALRPANGEPTEEQREAVDSALNVLSADAPVTRPDGATSVRPLPHVHVQQTSEKGGSNITLVVSVGGGLFAALVAMLALSRGKPQAAAFPVPDERTAIAEGNAAKAARRPAPPVVPPVSRPPMESDPLARSGARSSFAVEKNAAPTPAVKRPAAEPAEPAKAPVVARPAVEAPAVKLPPRPVESADINISPPYVPRHTQALCRKAPPAAALEGTAADGVLPDQYVMMGQLGRGGMGLVYLARDQRHNRDVAVKTLSGEAMRVQTVKERFLREYEALLSLDHPNIVRVYDVGCRQIPYYVMEYVGGQDLAAILLEQDINTEQAVEIGIQLSNALVHAHGMGVLHRDIKPSNLMIASDGRLKIVDFGLVKDLEAATLTMAGTVLGSLRFMAPEQLMGEKVDARADIYAVGSTLFFLYAGKTPYEGKPPATKVTQEAPTLQQVMGAKAHPEINTIIARCLRIKPADRYSTMREVEQAFRSIFF